MHGQSHTGKDRRTQGNAQQQRLSERIMWLRRWRRVNQPNRRRYPPQGCRWSRFMTPRGRLAVSAVHGGIGIGQVAMGGDHNGAVEGRFRSASRAMTRPALRLSRLPVGSSARTMAGSLISARAMAVRCISPPLELAADGVSAGHPGEPRGQLFSPWPQVCVGPARQKAGQTDVFQNGQGGQQVERLEHHADR
jgi:hypothetical protein